MQRLCQIGIFSDLTYLDGPTAIRGAARTAGWDRPLGKKFRFKCNKKASVNHSAGTVATIGAGVVTAAELSPHPRSLRRKDT